MGTKSRESIYGASIRASAERAKEARKEADRLACEAWNQRMLGYKCPARVRGHPYKRSHLVALRSTKISANDPPSTGWPGER
jgi:hypothetical protein